MNLLSNPIVVGELLIAGIILIKILCDMSTTKKTLNLTVLDIQLRSRIDPSIVELLDNFIQDCFNDYILLNKAFAKEQYVTEEDERDMVNAIATIVSDRISPTMFKQLSIYYNEGAIAGIISNKIYELVMVYTVDANKPKETLPEEE